MAQGGRQATVVRKRRPRSVDALVGGADDDTYITDGGDMLTEAAGCRRNCWQTGKKCLPSCGLPAGAFPPIL